jgi:hypothetical protein
LVDTILLLHSSISGAIHGRVPLIPPETIVVCFTLDKPKSATCSQDYRLLCFISHGKEARNGLCIHLWQLILYQHKHYTDGKVAHLAYRTRRVIEIHQ